MDNAILYGAQRLEAELPELGERELIGLAEENPQPEWSQPTAQAVTKQVEAA
jgi:hypothetical protein